MGRLSFLFLILYGASTGFSESFIEEKTYYLIFQEGVDINSAIGSGSIQDIENIHETSQDQENEIDQQESGCAHSKKEIRSEAHKEAGEEVGVTAKADKSKEAFASQGQFEAKERS